MSGATDSVVVRVPASTSNCGSGFDTLGIALQLYNTVTLTRAPGGVPLPERPADGRAQEMVVEAAAAFGEASGLKVEGSFKAIGSPSFRTNSTCLKSLSISVNFSETTSPREG